MKSPAFGQLSSIRDQTMTTIIEAKKAGRKVIGYYCTYTPVELAYAAGAIIVPLCASKKGPLVAADNDLPQNLCPVVRTIYDLAVTDSCPYFHFCDLVIAETTCDGKKKVYELLKRIKNLHIMNLPQVQDSVASLRLWESEIGDLVVSIEKTVGHKFSDEAIRDAIHLVNAETRLKKELFDLNQADPAIISGKELLIANSNLEFAVDRIAATKILREYIAEMKSLIREGINTGSKRKPRVLLTGCPVGEDDDKVVTLVEESGGQVVAMENCGIYKTVDLYIDENDTRDPITLLAEKYLSVPCSVMCPNDGRLILLEKMVEDFKIGGVIDLTWQACHTYNIESYRVGKLVKEKLGKAFLHLETNFSDADLENLRVRIEAFIEMIRDG
jgi:benzoyl-CoA reductase/2-hydroxyglutaryl-CoA dehydratase subunit BcrC/BadD/HgdB